MCKPCRNSCCLRTVKRSAENRADIREKRDEGSSPSDATETETAAKTNAKKSAIEPLKDLDPREFQFQTADTETETKTETETETDTDTDRETETATDTESLL